MCRGPLQRMLIFTSVSHTRSQLGPIWCSLIFLLLLAHSVLAVTMACAFMVELCMVCTLVRKTTTFPLTHAATALHHSHTPLLALPRALCPRHLHSM